MSHAMQKGALVLRGPGRRVASGPFGDRLLVAQGLAAPAAIAQDRGIAPDRSPLPVASAAQIGTHDDQG